MAYIESIWAQALYWGGMILGGISIPAVIGAIMFNYFKAKDRKRMEKLDYDKIIETVTERTVEKLFGKIKTHTFKHDIEPIAAEKVEEAGKRFTKDIRKDVKKIHEENAHLVACFDIFAHYYDNSFYITDEQKDKMHKALEEAKSDYSEKELAESVIIEEVKEEVKEEPKTEISPKKESKKTTSIER